MSSIDSSLFREVLGQYPTGVVVVTAVSADGDPLGMTVGSFTSVSLDPPLVAFLPSKSSSSWIALRASGQKFCINVLGADQEAICRSIAMRKADKFVDIDWKLTEHGNPLLAGAVAHIDCTIAAIHDAGDHDIVVASVEELAIHSSSYPLLFYRGGYGSFRPLSLATRDSALAEQLKVIDIARPHMDALAQHFDTEVAALALVGHELVLAATSGSLRGAVTPTRVGQRLPFVPPMGSVFAAWGSDELRASWLGHADSSMSETERAHYLEVADRVRQRGYALALGRHEVAHLERTWSRFDDGDPAISLESFRAELRQVAKHFNPENLEREGEFELRSLGAPVYFRDGTVAFSLTLWVPQGTISYTDLQEYVQQMIATCAAASADILQDWKDRNGSRHANRHASAIAE